MPIEILERIEVKRLQVLDEKGASDDSLMPELDDALVKRFFEKIVLSRTFNQRALSLQREGRIGTYASIWGQEAAEVGSALAFDEDDWIFPSFRESGVLISRGYPMHLLYRYWMGDERGMHAPDKMNIFPMSVPVGTQIPHCAGVAWGMRLKGAKTAAAVYFGDGGSSKGDFHEGLNFAGVFKVPAVFLCQNNQWAISVPRSRQSASSTIAVKGYAYGMEGVQVDGNDVLAVYKATKDALDKARAGGGPTLIELFTYRLDDHTTSDDASRYRPKEDVEAWKAREPLVRLRLFMERRGLWTKAYEDDVAGHAVEEIDRAIKEAEQMPPPDPADIIRHTYARPTPRQARELKELGWER